MTRLGEHTFMFKYSLEGVHYHVKFYAGQPGSRSLSGQFVLREADWKFFMQTWDGKADFEKLSA
jgi:hypothetical protein